MNIGFVGLGIMGAPMAENLLRKGCDLWVNDVNPAAMARLAQAGATPASLQEIAAACPLVLLILPSEAVSREVLFASDGLMALLRPGATVVDMSSLTPTFSRECASRLQEKGIHFLDAPVSGGEPKAIDGTLSFMVGGDTPVFERVAPYLAMMGTSVVQIGESGSGSVAKLANQVIVNLGIAAVAEAFVLVAKAGVDPEKVYAAIRGGLAGSTVLDAKLPKIVQRDFAPGGKISINMKDIGHVLATAHDLGVPMPFTANLFEIMKSLKLDGLLDADHAALVRYFEKLAQVEVQTLTGEPADKETTP